MDLAAIKELAGRLAPMTTHAVPILPGRTLYIDGDCLAYTCAGREGTSKGEARAYTSSTIDSLQVAAQAEKVVILLTGSGSHKGHRYALARVKSYQGQRASGRRPDNWAFLRELLEAGTFGTTILDYDREADDRFGEFGWADPENTVIATQDKDMRSVPGYHLDWQTRRMFYLAPGTYDFVFADKQYGEKWFWLQMLHGDTADNIPGLPLAYGKKCGEVTAGKLLAPAEDAEQAAAIVAAAYVSCYKENAVVALAEQASLLWMRHTSQADWNDIFKEGGPMRRLHSDGAAVKRAYFELKARVQQAKEINDLTTQALGDSPGTSWAADQARRTLCNMQADLQAPSTRS